MATISVCMIVKNEEKTLAKCLDSLRGLYEELIIVDTGSTDRTKEIAARYTDKIYDFEWIDDFAAARNYAFSLATKEYIYSADADESLDEVNRERFKILKEAMLPEIEVVQMKYGNQLENGTVYNYDEEYRPKLFRRLRTFTWIDPIHETIRVFPVVFDSDIIITHKQEEIHAKRDFRIFEKEIAKGNPLSSRLIDLYARELYLAGEIEDLEKAEEYFKAIAENDEFISELMLDACAVLVKYHNMLGKPISSCTYVGIANDLGGCSEVCVELARYYIKQGEYEAARAELERAMNETEPVLDINCGEEIPRELLTSIVKK
ncbi:MAG: glycosyltransferase family 2 protein [Lachnospiraceae bacterium]|nr:glycosyltransferase family 2 protein [Lachnospiraceae bacterium]